MIKQQPKTKSHKVYETRANQDYLEWDHKYTVAWKGYEETINQNLQDLIASTRAIEEYWSTAEAGGKK